jgi:hypothetical protein
MKTSLQQGSAASASATSALSPWTPHNIIAKVHGACGDHDLQVGAQADDALARTAIRTLASTARSTRLLTRVRMLCS